MASQRLQLRRLQEVTKMVSIMWYVWLGGTALSLITIYALLRILYQE